MRNTFIKTILPSVIIGSVVTSLALSGFPNGSGLDKAEAAAASSASLSFSKFLDNNAPKRTLRSVNGINTVTNLSSTVVLVNKQRNLPSKLCTARFGRTPNSVQLLGTKPQKADEKNSGVCARNAVRCCQTGRDRPQSRIGLSFLCNPKSHIRA